MVNPEFPRPSIETPQNAAIRAMSVFVSANAEFPFVTATQAAKIALDCKQSGEKPRELLSALESQPLLIQKLRDWGNRAHGRSDSEQAPSDMTILEADEAIGQVFSWADTLMSLDPEDLSRITSSYRSADGERIEFRPAMKMANDLLRAKAKNTGQDCGSLGVLPRPEDYEGDENY